MTAVGKGNRAGTLEGQISLIASEPVRFVRGITNVQVQADAGAYLYGEGRRR
jgi:hypothetical protein